MIDIQQLPDPINAGTIFTAPTKSGKPAPPRIGLPTQIFVPSTDETAPIAGQKPQIVQEVQDEVVTRFLPYWYDVFHIPPPVEIADSVKPMLTDRMQIVLKSLLPLIQVETHRYGVQLRKIAVSGFVDPEEDHDSVVVTSWVNVGTGYALEYWDQIALHIDNWTRSLANELRPVAERIAIAVEWNV